jgi:molybdenum cofactor cytidylyltransferase
VHGCRRGHPTVIAWKHVAGIRALANGEWINSYLRAQSSETLEVPVADAGILDDLDTPADLDRLRNKNEELFSG